MKRTLNDLLDSLMKLNPIYPLLILLFLLSNGAILCLLQWLPQDNIAYFMPSQQYLRPICKQILLLSSNLVILGFSHILLFLIALKSPLLSNQAAAVSSADILPAKPWGHLAKMLCTVVCMCLGIFFLLTYIPFFLATPIAVVAILFWSQYYAHLAADSWKAISPELFSDKDLHKKDFFSEYSAAFILVFPIVLSLGTWILFRYTFPHAPASFLTLCQIGLFLFYIYLLSYGIWISKKDIQIFLTRYPAPKNLQFNSQQKEEDYLHEISLANLELLRPRYRTSFLVMSFIVLDISIFLMDLHEFSLLCNKNHNIFYSFLYLINVIWIGSNYRINQITEEKIKGIQAYLTTHNGDPLNETPHESNKKEFGTFIFFLIVFTLVIHSNDTLKYIVWLKPISQFFLLYFISWFMTSMTSSIQKKRLNDLYKRLFQIQKNYPQKLPEANKTPPKIDYIGNFQKNTPSILTYIICSFIFIAFRFSGPLSSWVHSQYITFLDKNFQLEISKFILYVSFIYLPTYAFICLIDRQKIRSPIEDMIVYTTGDTL